MNNQQHTKRKALLAGQEVEGFLYNDGEGNIIAVLTDVQYMNNNVTATVTPHSMTPGHVTPWRRSLVSGTSEKDIMQRYVKAQQNTIRIISSTLTDLDSHLLSDIDQ